MRRIVLQGPELAGFSSLGFDDHIKLFVPGADGATVMRDYTPRQYDAASHSLVIDFALHDAGPATAWAIAAQPGDTCQVGGPRGSTIVPDDFDWHLLVGDETALPAIGRRVEELGAGAKVTTVVVVDSAQGIQTFETAAVWTGEWVCRDAVGDDDVGNVGRAIDRLYPIQGEGFVWIAGEAQFAKSLRAHMIERHGHPIQWMKAAGYWVRGAEGVHQPIG
jgi:NADPH-dependent ferric siderophore reductase